ncbi:hypothetical protein [Beduinella massiliensis]|uniref:hypothetical protein n=1 Tax=Beduinella massiliensis TaxID=1852363 RepID=UPI000C84B99E
MTYKDAAKTIIKEQFCSNIFKPAFAGGVCGCPYHYFNINRYAVCHSQCRKCWQSKYRGETVKDFARFDGIFSFTKPEHIGKAVEK